MAAERRRAAGLPPVLTAPRRLVGLAGLCGAIAYILASLRLPMGSMADPGAGVFPLAVGVAFALVSLGVVVEPPSQPADGGPTTGEPFAAGAMTVDGEPITQDAADEEDRRGPRRRVLLVALLIGYALTLEILGFFVGTLLFAVASIRLLGEASIVRTVLYAATMAAGSYVLFVTFLELPLPDGMWLP